MWFIFVKIITSVLCLDKFWNIYRMFISIWSIFWEILSFIGMVVCSVEIHLCLNIICFEYFSCNHALLFLAKLFIASCWLDVLPCINFVATESVLSLCFKIIKVFHAFHFAFKNYHPIHFYEVKLRLELLYKRLPIY